VLLSSLTTFTWNAKLFQALLGIQIYWHYSFSCLGSRAWVFLILIHLVESFRSYPLSLPTFVVDRRSSEPRVFEAVKSLEELFGAEPINKA